MADEEREGARLEAESPGAEARRNCHLVRYRNLRELAVRVDAAEPDGYLHHAWEELIGSGTAYLYISPRADTAERIASHLADAHRELGMKRVYCDKIFAYEPNITTCTTDADGALVCDWSQVDEIYDRILSLGVRPFVTISAVPRALARDPDNRCFDGGNASPPRDLGMWKEAVKRFAAHLVERYGEKEVLTWYFQVLNEPELSALYWSGTHEEWFACYDYAATGIKEVNHGLKVGPGGFASAHGHLICSFLDHVSSRNHDPAGDPGGAPMDFINSHAYPLGLHYDPESSPSPMPGRDLPVDGSLRNDLEKLHRHLVSRFGPGHGKEMMISEWNGTADFGDLYHESAMNAAFIVRQVSECSREFFNDPSRPTMFCFWCHSDVFDECGEPDAEFCGLFGLVTRNGIRKPAYNAFRMLHALGKSRVRMEGCAGDVGGLATYNDETIRILLYNCACDPLRVDGDPKMGRLVDLRVNNIPWPRVRIEHHRVDDRLSNAFSAWKEIGSPRDCTPGQMEALRGRMNLEELEEARIVPSEDGIFRSRFELPMPAVSMITITPVEREFIPPRPVASR